MPHAKANGVNLFYELRGPASAPVVVFSHSIGSSLEMWDGQIAELAGRYRCLRYDTRGHGRSEVIDKRASIDDLADDLAGLLDALGIAWAHVVGLSLGGMTGQAFALRHPQKLDRLVLMATTAKMNPKDWQERVEVVRRDGYGSFIEGVMSPRWFTPAFAKTHPDVIAVFRERFMAIDRRGYIACCAAIETLDLPERIGAIKAPTLIMVGAEDIPTPVAMSEDLRRRIPGAEMIILPGLGHLFATEAPWMVNPYLIDFLERGRAAADQKAPVRFEDGLAIRKAVLGDDYVEAALAKAGSFGMPWQDFITRAAWGEIWGDPALPWKTRSMLTLAMMVALHREEEFKLHLRPAIRNGVSVAELQALIKQSAVYAGIPAANAGMRWLREVLGDELK